VHNFRAVGDFERWVWEADSWSVYSAADIELCYCRWHLVLRTFAVAAEDTVGVVAISLVPARTLETAYTEGVVYLPKSDAGERTLGL
jgi:hypothetical protein